LSRWQEYIVSFKHLIMLYYIGGLIITFGVGFFVGANNPPRQILQKLLNKHKDSIDKIMKS